MAYPDKCKIPECTDISNKWHLCDLCMAATVRQFLHVMGDWDISRNDMPPENIKQKALDLVKWVEASSDELLAERARLKEEKALENIVLEFE